ncbi:hypothetical protein [Symbioplanes lichenis]|uniref:hypothetical protein n=1 Tax=Symbioplanes lichenis TaxID=1629072 RepID=UPI0027390C75|nr:hypothetical protein [Actinoplanes lichenis]
MVTGYDSVIIARSPAGPGIRAMLDALHTRWPAMLVGRSTAEETGIDPFLPWPRARGDVAPEAGELYVARDATMEQDWDDYGYDLRPDGEGPFAVLYRPLPHPATTISLTEDPASRPDPYDAVLITAGLSLITVVTPDETSPFSRDIHDRLTRAFIEQPESANLTPKQEPE